MTEETRNDGHPEGTEKQSRHSSLAAKLSADRTRAESFRAHHQQMGTACAVYRGESERNTVSCAGTGTGSCHPPVALSDRFCGGFRSFQYTEPGICGQRQEIRCPGSYMYF